MKRLETSGRPPAGSHLMVLGAASVAADVVDLADAAHLVIDAFVDETGSSPSEVLGHPVVGSIDRWIGCNEVAVVVAIGDNAVRRRVVARLAVTMPEARFATLIHPAATVSQHARIGQGSIVLAGARVAARTFLGSFAQLNMNVVVSHDCVVEDFASMNSGSALGGRCRLGAGSSLGLNSSVRERVSIGTDVIVGANSFVNRDLTDLVVAGGVPARVLRQRQPGDAYLR